MAAAVHRLFFTARRCTCQIPSRSRAPLKAPYRPFRAFTTFPPTARRNKDDDDDYDDDEDDGLFPSQRTPVSFIDSLDPRARAHYEALSPKEREAFEAEARKMDEYMTSPGVESELSAAVSQAVHQVSLESPQVDMPPSKIRPGFMAMGEEDEQGTGEDDEFEDDDITSLGHGELEQHREMREYARIAAWEMPLLSSMSTHKTITSAGLYVANTRATVQNWRSHTNPLPWTNLFASATQPTWANVTPPRRKSC